MPVKLTIGSEIRSFDFKAFSSSEILISDGRECVTVNFPLELDSSCDPEDYTLFFLSRKGVRENDIFQVHDKETSNRIGWVFPAQALASNNHDYYNNPHFLKYAYVAAIKAIKEAGEHGCLNVVDYRDEPFEIVEFFHETTCFLVIYNKNMPETYNGDYELLSPSLFSHGYANLKSVDPRCLEFEGRKPGGEKIYIRPVSCCVDNYKIIGEILDRSISVEGRPLFKFFFIYQIVELLIDNIYKIEQEGLVEQLIESKGDSGKTKEVVNKVSDFLSEKKRLALLIETYSQAKNCMDELRSSCNFLLRKLGKEEKNEFQEYFYSIRNFIFHQYRDFPGDREEELGRVVDEMVDVLPHILTSFTIK